MSTEDKLQQMDVKKWFKRLDRFNAVEPFVFDREQPDVPERDCFATEREEHTDSSHS